MKGGACSRYCNVNTTNYKLISTVKFENKNGKMPVHKTCSFTIQKKRQYLNTFRVNKLMEINYPQSIINQYIVKGTTSVIPHKTNKTFKKV